MRSVISFLLVSLFLTSYSFANNELNGLTFAISSANANTGNKVLTIDNKLGQAGADIGLTAYQGQNSEWLFTSTGAPNEYYITVVDSRAGVNKYLDAASGSARKNGGVVFTYPSTTGGTQKWVVTKNTDGTFKIQNIYGGKCLDADGYTLRSARTKIQVWDCGTQDNQKWKLTAVDPFNGKRFKISSANASTGNKVLTIDNKLGQAGADIGLTAYQGQNSEWLFTSSGAPNEYYITVVDSRARVNKYLDAASGSARKNGGVVFTYPSTTGGTQKWVVTKNTDGTFKIQNIYGGKCLDADGYTLRSARTKIQVWDCGTQDNQKWKLTPVQ